MIAFASNASFPGHDPYNRKAPFSETETDEEKRARAVDTVFSDEAAVDQFVDQYEQSLNIGNIKKDTRHSFEQLDSDGEWRKAA